MQHDPGGKVSLPLKPGVDGFALYSEAPHLYRYRLARQWREDGPAVLVIMMNPSTAQMDVDDPTVAKITRMARAWRNGAFGRLLVGNVFAYRATNQTVLGEVDDPIGPDNDRHLMDMARQSDLAVFAYGLPKVARLRARGPAVARMVAAAGIQPHALRVSTGAPWHPLYLPDATEPEPWTIAP